MFQVITNLQMLFDDSVAVKKRVIQAMTQLYKVALVWICTAKTVSDAMEAVWAVITRIKDNVVRGLDGDNDGVRTHTIKFMEMLVLSQTTREEGSSGRLGADFSLDDVPLTLKIIRRRKLEEEAGVVFEDLCKYHGSMHISSANLMTCMVTLTNIAKSRPLRFMPRVITAMEMLQANLPPTLAKSQVSAVRKHLKNQLLALFKHPLASERFFQNITTLLTDLGATREEVLKAMPTFEEVLRKQEKKARKEEEKRDGGASKAKVRKMESSAADDEDDEEDDDEEDEEEKRKKAMEDHTESAVDITEKFILDKLTPAMATELVMRSMWRLPRDIPPHFHNTYTPIAAAGTEGQVKHVARLLATQLTSAKLGPGVESMRQQNRADLKRKQSSKSRDQDDDDDDERGSVIGSVLGAASDRASKIILQPTGLGMKKSNRTRTLKLNEVTKELSKEELKQMQSDAMQRILRADRAARLGGVLDTRMQIVTRMAAQASPELKSHLLAYIFADLQSRADFAFSWLFEEYSHCQGFSRATSVTSKRGDDAEYNALIAQLIRGVISKTTGKECELLLRRLYLEAPIITEEAISLLKQFIQREGTAIIVVNLMKNLVMNRPTKKLNFLNFLLEFCYHEVPQVRDTANKTVLQLHINGDFNDIIDDYAIMYLKFLLAPTPPPMLFGEERGRPQVVPMWTDAIIRVCLHLCFSLLPHNLRLFYELSEVYVAANGEIKRTILRVLETPVRTLSMNNQELLNLIGNCPKGAETLITRIVHILTEKTRPTPELVDRVRMLYEKRVSDVRFLIPVLNGLSKQEVIGALPKLIQLNPVVVKEVFNRLLQSSGSEEADGPLSPADLLIALHNIDPAKCDVKVIIKATALCFQDKHIYTHEVLAIVLKQLVEQQTIPILFMRTVLQTVTAYPRLLGFVMNILQRLIMKQVWKTPKAWDGFIRCCEKTTPQSYAVMLQLPPNQLRRLLDSAPDMREPLLEHVQGFTESQRAHVKPAIMGVLYNADVGDDVIKVERDEDEGIDNGQAGDAEGDRADGEEAQEPVEDDSLL
jgi:symplekin